MLLLLCHTNGSRRSPRRLHLAGTGMETLAFMAYMAPFMACKALWHSRRSPWVTMQ